MLEKFVAALRGSLRKVEPTSTSCNNCGTKKVARHVLFRVCYTGQFFVQLVSQQNCETSCKKRLPSLAALKLHASLLVYSAASTGQSFRGIVDNLHVHAGNSSCYGS